MDRRCLFLCVLFLVGLIFPSFADACNRCGRFRGCSSCYNTAYYPVVQKVATPVVYQAPQKTDVFVVQNSYPAPLVGQGTSTYLSAGQASYGNAALPLLDPNQYLSQSLQLVRAANDTAAVGHARADSLFTRLAELQAPTTERLAAGQAGAMVLQAAGLDPSYNAQRGQSSAVVITRDNYGRVQTIPLDQQQVTTINEQYQRRVQTQGGPPAPPAPRPPHPTNMDEYPEEPPPSQGGDSRYPALSTFCFKCHGIDRGQPEGGFYIGEDPNVIKDLRAGWFDVVQRVKDGSMPPANFPAQPTKEERVAIINELEQMILSQAQGGR